MEKTETRRELVDGYAPKYATYSKSEVDQMFKQQAEAIGNSLGSKISSQQRVFQEAVERQEKSFSKLSDTFVVQFDSTRVKLETSSKQSTETISAELEAFKKDLSKELEQYRAQINKTIVPVAKFIEEKNTKPAERAQKEIAQQSKSQQSQGAVDKHLMQTMIIVNIVLLILVPLATLLVIVMPELKKLEYALSTMQERVSSQAPAKTGAGNRSPSTESEHPVSTGGDNN